MLADHSRFGEEPPLLLHAKFNIGWGIALFVAVAVIRYGPARFRQELIELEPSHVRLGRLYDWTITYLIPVQFAVMFGWWMYQAVVVYDPEAW